MVQFFSSLYALSLMSPWNVKWDDILYFTFQGLMRERAYRLEKNWTILLAKNADGVEGAIRWALRTFAVSPEAAEV